MRIFVVGVFAGFAVGGVERRGGVPVFSSHNRHGDSSLHRVDEIWPVSLPQNAFHGGREIEELELHFQVGEGIIRRELVVVHYVVSFFDGRNVQRNASQSRKNHVHAVGLVGAFQDELAAGGSPDVCHFEVRTIEREGELIDRIVPLGDLVGSHGESVGNVAEDDAEGLNPSVVSLPSLWSGADEVGIDLNSVVGYESKVSVFHSMEVEHHSISTHEAGIVAD